MRLLNASHGKADRGSIREAVQLLEEGIANNPDSGELYAALGQARMQMPDPRQAISALKRAISLDPENSRYHYLLARAYLAEEQKPLAEKEMRQSRALLQQNSEGSMEFFSRGPTPGTEPNTNR